MVAGPPCLDEREAKFLPDPVAAHAVWAIASRHLRPQQETAAYAYARTTYFDTHDLEYYRSRGCRLRVREYASATRADEVPTVADVCYLEVKRSIDGRRTKTRLALRPDQVDAELAAMVDVPLMPCVTTLYRRRALVDDAGTLRVTLDDGVRFCRPRAIGAPLDYAEHDVIAHGPSLVLEYKSSAPPPVWLARALTLVDEAIGFSKFTLGMDAVLSHKRRELDRRLLLVGACTG
jgi:hypothetical protein